MLAVQLPADFHAQVKSKAALSHSSMQEVVEKALEQWLNADMPKPSPHDRHTGAKKKRTSESGLNIPPSMVPLIEWLLDLFAEKGDHDEEMLKDTLRLLTARRAADLKRSAVRPKKAHTS